MAARTRFLLTILFFASATLACGGSNNNPAGPTPPSAPFATTDLRVGTGTEATLGRNISVHYTGWLYDPSRPEGKGNQFDTSAGRGPFSFVLGTTVITGWNQGIPGMRVGGARRLVIPPELAYGGTPRQGIPANSTLVFDVELLAVQ